jgi:hypothetical protein
MAFVYAENGSSNRGASGTPESLPLLLALSCKLEQHLEEVEHV